MVKAPLCKEGKVVCADTQTITGAVWTGCSHIVIPLVHSFHYRWLTSKDAFSQTCNTGETMLNEPGPFKFGFRSKPTLPAASSTPRLRNWSFGRGLLVQAKWTFSTLSSRFSPMITNTTKSELSSKEAMGVLTFRVVLDALTSLSSLCVMMFSASGQSPPSETRGSDFQLVVSTGPPLQIYRSLRCSESEVNLRCPRSPLEEAPVRAPLFV